MPTHSSGRMTRVMPDLLARPDTATRVGCEYPATASTSSVNVDMSQMVETDVITKEISTSYRYTYLVVNGLLHYDWPDLLK